MSDTQDIYAALADLRRARDIIGNELRGTNDSRYEFWKWLEHSTKAADAAFKRLCEKEWRRP